MSMNLNTQYAKIATKRTSSPVENGILHETRSQMM